MASINQDDFNRLQVQLLDLREINCTLKETSLKQKKELLDKQSRLKILEEENSRLANAVKGSKRASEIDLHQRDNENLRARLRDQEEDFRLQNNTLLQELSKLVGENESLEQQVNALCRDSISDSNEHSCTDDVKKLMGLRGELTLLEKKLKDNEAGWSSEVKSLRDRMAVLNNKNMQLTNVLKLHSIPIDEGEIDLNDEAVSFKKLSLQDAENKYEGFDTSDGADVNKWMEKVKILEKDLHDANTKIINCQQNDASDQIKLELKNINEDKNKLENTILELNQDISLKQEQIDSITKSETELNTKLEDMKATFIKQTNLLESKELEILDLKTKLNECNSNIQELESAVQDRNLCINDFEKKSVQQTSEIEALEIKMFELSEVSDNRRKLIEEMRGHIETEEMSHKQELEKLRSNHEQELESKLSIILELQTEKSDLEKEISLSKTLQEKLAKLQVENGKLSSKILQLNEQLNNNDVQFQNERDRIEAEKLQEIDQLQLKWDYDKKDWSTQLEISTIQKQELEDKVESLQSQVTDGEEERKIHERKGLTMMKDLKKQLSSERKRADRLQEKLGQLLDLNQVSTFTSNILDKSDDVSSVSSWSMVSGEPRDTSSSDHGLVIVPPLNINPDNVSDETASLVGRITRLQQEKWHLEERISHLESSSASMADDLLKKSALIQHYCIEDHAQPAPPSPSISNAATSSNVTDKIGVKRVLDALRDMGKGEESLREINRRLHLLLEETLAKNMHLHTDVENLTHQVQELTKLAASQAQQGTIISKEDIEMDVTDGLVD